MAKSNQETADPIRRLAVSQSPGDFFWFWNLVVPLSLLFNIRQFGLRIHELGLILALSLNPYALKQLIQYPLLAWACLIFLMVWIERILSRWRWYRIYHVTFLKNIVMLVLFIAIPSLIIRYVWYPLYDAMAGLFRGINPELTDEHVNVYRNVAMLILAGALLLHSLYFHSVFTGLDLSVLGRCFSLRRCDEDRCSREELCTRCRADWDYD